MALAPSELTDLSDRFFSAFNSRDYASATDLYASDAIYESPALEAPGRLTGRNEIIGYFTAALEDDRSFQLSVVEQFTGLNMVLTLSANGGTTFVDVLKVNDAGQIVEHLEVTPQASTALSGNTVNDK